MGEYLPGVVVDVVREDGGGLRHFAVLAGDVWETSTPAVNEAAGFARVQLPEVEFRAWIKARAHRLRVNALTGGYDYGV